MKGHYLMVVLPVGKFEVRREYLPLEREDETVEEALERWILQHPDMVARQRNREKTARRLRGTPISTKLCRPSSWHRQQCERDGVAYPRPVGKRGRRGRQ